MNNKMVYENGLRKAVIKEGTHFVKGKHTVDYYYDGELDYEAIKGNHGIPTRIFDTLKQAQRNAQYYVNKK